MRHARHHLDSLVELHRLPDGEPRLGAWRQGMATLAAEAADRRPLPLEGVNPKVLWQSVRVALADGLVDGLDFLSTAHAAAALYELAAALPVSEERREIGRRVLRHLQGGDAVTFVALAERLALGTRHGLTGASTRARIALALDSPIGADAGVDSLAFVIMSRPDLERSWLNETSTGSLPSRRLAAKLIERAAREILRRSSLQQPGVVSLIEKPSVQASWNRLEADREPLVWRYVASARGLLARLVPSFEAEIARDLDPSLSPTEWRRGGASLAAMVALEPDEAVGRCRRMLQGEVFKRDPGIASAMILGLSRAAEAEPDAADALLVDLIQVGGFDAVEALVALRQERLDSHFGRRAADLARQRFRQAHFAHSADDGRAALLRALDSELAPAEERLQQHTLRENLCGALAALAKNGARAAHARSYAVLEAVENVLERLESADNSTSKGRQQAFLALREIDQALLETSTLASLLALGASADATVLEPLDEHFERLTDWLTREESEPLLTDGQVEHFALRLSRLRAMLHLVDADTAIVQSRSSEQRDRRLRTAQLLLRRVSEDAPSSLRRVVAAAAARACDALLRDEIGELSDVLFLIIDNVSDAEDLTTMAEATMDPDMVLALQGYLRLVKTTALTSRMTVARSRSGLQALEEFVVQLPTVGSPRVEALRGALAAYAGAIQTLLSMESLARVAGDGEPTGSSLPPLASAAGLLARLTAGARRRMGASQGDDPPLCSDVLRQVDTGVEHALRGDPTPLRDSVSTALATLHDELPVHLADVAEQALARLVALPTDHADEKPFDLIRARGHAEPPLPAWIPPSRILGAFYVLRPLGAGGSGSVFVACRTEDRGRKQAPRLALKVPEYGGDVAHTLSETEFLQLFREEAGALLSVPPHENLASLVTFDAGVKPKPILVMELVEGPTLQRLIDTRVLDSARALRVLLGIADGLEAMHAVGVGHLDLKPSNVILRSPHAGSPRSVDMRPTEALQRVSRLPTEGMEDEEPVLVDFGLAGRNLRPGCATVNYGSPEVWGYVPEGHDPRPMAADVYAYACVVYETLVCDELFQDSSHIGILASHLTHDGNPPRLSRLSGSRPLEDLAGVLQMALRQDPRLRCTITELRHHLARIDLGRLPWPIA